MHNPKQRNNMLTALPGVPVVQCWPEAKYMWSNNAPINDLCKIYFIQ